MELEGRGSHVSKVQEQPPAPAHTPDTPGVCALSFLSSERTAGPSGCPGLTPPTLMEGEPKEPFWGSLRPHRGFPDSSVGKESA